MKKYLLMLLPLMVLTACGGVEKEAKYPTGMDRDGAKDDIYAKPESIFGKEGLSILGSKSDDDDDDGSKIGVNGFLWRASLETISFMPVASADPFGGVIITDWYSPPENSGERLKINAFILSRQLKSDGISVKIFRQVKKGGEWQDSPVDEDTGRKIEDTILSRAREMRVDQMRGAK
jgi:hypothetical protein